MKCDDCGNDKGRETTCPYAEEIHCKIIDIFVYEDCEYERAMDI